MKIILSTRNPSKVEQIKALFNQSDFTLLTLTDVGVEGEAVEDGLTLAENALKKAHFARVHSNMSLWTMADDTGLFIDALDGKPGIKAARWAGETATTDEITRYTLEQLRGKTNRAATFETVVALISPGGIQHIFSGKCPGRIIAMPRVPPQPKMPYSPIFIPDGSNLVWAEMSTEAENAVSHRGKAFRQAREFLEKNM